MDRFILVIPVSKRFLPLVRRAVNTLVHETGLTPNEVFDLQLAVTEACNLVNHVYSVHNHKKVVSITGMFDKSKFQVTIDDGSGRTEGSRVRRQIYQQTLPLEGSLAYRAARRLCDEVVLSSGLTGGLRIELTKTFSSNQEL